MRLIRRLMDALKVKARGSRKQSRPAGGEGCSLFCPEHDEATDALGRWVRTWSLKETDVFVGDSAKRDVLLRRLNSNGPRKVLFLGHGLPDHLLGHLDHGVALDDDALFRTPDNCSSLLSAREVEPSRNAPLTLVAWACFAARGFSDSFANSRGSFFGFFERFEFAWGEPVTETVWNSILESFFQDVERGLGLKECTDRLREKCAAERGRLKELGGPCQKINEALLRRLLSRLPGS